MLQPDISQAEFFCDCIAQENQKFPIDDQEMASSDQLKKIQLDDLWKQHQNSLYHLSTQIVKLDNTLFSKHTEAKEVGERCREILFEEIASIRCAGETIYSKQEIEQMKKSVYSLAENEINAKYGLMESKLIDKQKLTCSDGSSLTLTEAQLSDLTAQTTPMMARILIEAAKKSSLDSLDSIQDLFSTDDFIDNQLDQNMRVLRSIVNADPLLSSFYTSPQSIELARDFDPTKIEQLTNNLGKMATQNILKNCQQIKSNTEAILCTNKNENLAPNHFPSFQSQVEKAKTLDGTVSSQLEGDIFCKQNRADSKYTKIKQQIARILPEVENKDEQYNPQKSYFLQHSAIYESLCPYIPPPLERRARLAAKKKDCQQTGDELSYECLYIGAMEAYFPSESEIRSQVAQKIKKEKPQISSDQLTTEIEKRLEQMNYSQLVGAEKQPAGIAAAFLGLNSASVKNKELASFDTTNPTQAVQFPSPIAGIGAKTQNQNSNAKTLAKTSSFKRADTRIQKNMQNFYDEVNRRIRSENQKLAASTTAGSNSFPNYLKSAFTPPKRKNKPVEFKRDYAQVANINQVNFNDQPARFYGGKESLPPIKPQDLNPKIKAQINAALLAGYRERSARVAGKRSLGPAPISVEGLGENALANEIPRITISSSLDEDLEAMVAGDFEMAGELLALLKGKSKTIEIVHKDNPKFRADITRVNGKFKVIATGNQADKNYMSFVKSIKESFNLKDRFQSFIQRLDEIVNGNSVDRGSSESYNTLDQMFN